jgi:hypothetical protein
MVLDFPARLAAGKVWRGQKDHQIANGVGASHSTAGSDAVFPAWISIPA